ncbi:MAG: amidase, partial [Thermoleophilia bacterium]|nr:amidase [Thermoleophilia bacterium]
MKPSKMLSTGAAVAVPVVLTGMVFSTLLLLAPAKPAAADCGPAVSVVIDGSTKVDG